MNNFGSRLKVIRKAIFNMSRAQFCDLLKIPEITLRSWESGRTNISEQYFEIIFPRLNQGVNKFTREWLLSGQGVSPFDTDSSSKNTEQNTNFIDNFLIANSEAMIYSLSKGLDEYGLKKGTILGLIKSTINGISSPQIIALSKDRKEFDIGLLSPTDSTELLFRSILDNKLKILKDPKMLNLYEIVFALSPTLKGLKG